MDNMAIAGFRSNRSHVDQDLNFRIKLSEESSHETIIPAVEKGVIEAMHHGIVAGFPGRRYSSHRL